MDKLVPIMGWTFTSLATNANNIMTNVVPLIVSILGGVAIVGAVYMIVTGLISHGKKQTSWLVAIILLILGIGLFVTGIGMLTSTMNPNGAVGELFQ